MATTQGSCSVWEGNARSMETKRFFSVVGLLFSALRRVNHCAPVFPTKQMKSESLRRRERILCISGERRRRRKFLETQETVGWKRFGTRAKISKTMSMGSEENDGGDDIEWLMFSRWPVGVRERQMNGYETLDTYYLGKVWHKWIRLFYLFIRRD